VTAMRPLVPRDARIGRSRSIETAEVAGKVAKS
jgi:hypothetical protein